MAPEEAVKMLKAKLDCMIREYSGIDEDCNASNCDNCKLNYEQGTVGEQKEALRVAISTIQTRSCATCKHNPPSKKYPCVDCDMRDPADRWERRDAGDTISRQAAIDALKSLPTWWADEGGYYGGAKPPMVALLDPEDAISAVENLPAAQTEPQWIPVSERLPEEDDYKPCAEVPDGAVWYYTENGTTGLGYYYKSTKEWSTTDDLKTDGRVLAWKPLPEPYKAEK